MASGSYASNRGGGAMRGDAGKGGSMSMSYQVGSTHAASRDDDSSSSSSRDFRDTPVVSSSSLSSAKYPNSSASGTDLRLLEAAQLNYHEAQRPELLVEPPFVLRAACEGSF